MYRKSSAGIGRGGVRTLADLDQLLHLSAQLHISDRDTREYAYSHSVATSMSVSHSISRSYRSSSGDEEEEEQHENEHENENFRDVGGGESSSDQYTPRVKQSESADSD